jgi:hypothetical protein
MTAPVTDAELRRALVDPRALADHYEELAYELLMRVGASAAELPRLEALALRLALKLAASDVLTAIGVDWR